MKKIYFFVLFIISTVCASAQIQTRYFESKDAFNSISALMKIDAKETALKQMPQFDARKLLEEDRELEGLDVPFRFGKSFDVDYTLKDGVWTKQNDKRIWNMRFSSSGAYSLNFIFS
jgi:hypothetical protein